MTKKRPWYRSLSTPSQIVLAVFLGLCLFFTVGLFKRADDYLAARTQLERTLARRSALEQTGEDLRTLQDDLDRVKEGMVRDSRYARPGENVVQLPPEPSADPGTEQAGAALDSPVWQQWLELLFGSD
jgi:hypothetical protein